jgi:hypothetical protein
MVVRQETPGKAPMRDVFVAVAFLGMLAAPVVVGLLLSRSHTSHAEDKD